MQRAALLQILHSGYILRTDTVGILIPAAIASPVTHEGVIRMSDSDVMTEAPEASADAVYEDEYEVLEVTAMHASMTAIGSVMTEELEASQCAIGSASVDGDASLATSVVGVLSADSVGVHQGGAAVMIVDGDVSIDQGAAQVIVARTVGIDQGGVGTLVAGEANIARSWVGLMAARNATLSDDSRVIVDARSALIIGAGLLGGLCMLAAAIFMGARRDDL